MAVCLLRTAQRVLRGSACRLLAESDGIGVPLAQHSSIFFRYAERPQWPLCINDRVNAVQS